MTSLLFILLSVFLLVVLVVYLYLCPTVQCLVPLPDNMYHPRSLLCPFPLPPESADTTPQDQSHVRVAGVRSLSVFGKNTICGHFKEHS